MSESLPIVEPDGFVSGDRVRWTRSITVLGVLRDPADSWVLSYSLVSPDTKLTLTGSDNGDGTHLIDLPAATTADYPPGVYAWQAYVSKTTDRFLVGKGSICIEPNFSALTSYDGRTWARRMLSLVEKMIEGKGSRTDVASHTLGGHSLTRYSPAELMEWRDRLRAEVGKQDRAERVRRGLGHGGNIRVRL